MKIAALIRSYIASKPTIYGLNGEVVPCTLIEKEFLTLRQWFASCAATEDRIALQLRKDYRYFLAILACMESGTVFIPLRLSWPERRVEQIKSLSGCRTVVTDEMVTRILAAPITASTHEIPLEGNRPLYCLFTSGTTGEPKGVVIARSAYESFLSWVETFFSDIGTTDRLLNSTDYTFDVSLAEIGITLTRRPAFYCSRFENDLFVLLQELHESRISVIATVPNNLMMLLDRRLVERVDLTALKYLLVAGARFPLALVQQLNELLPKARIYNCYGPTEATIYCIARELVGERSDFVVNETVSVGQAILGCEALVVDDDMRQKMPGEKGELLVGGAQLMIGYENNPDATANAMVVLDGKHYYRTGDLAFTDGKGQYYVAGRNDDTVKVAGQRVNLSDIDAYVEKLDFVTACATVAANDPIRGVRLVLYLVTNTQVTREVTLAALAEVLVPSQIPQDLIFCSNLPVNNSGKTCKRTLLSWYSNGKSIV